MKIIHAADIHLGSKMDSRFPKEIAEKRKTEVRNTFRRLAKYAAENGVCAVLLAGDVFDSDIPFKKDKDFFYSVIENTPSVDFLYLRGNHDSCGGYEGRELPNFKTFGPQWREYVYGNVAVRGIEMSAENASSLYSTLELPKDRLNIVMLHGQTADAAGKDRVCLKRLRGKNIDYLALGHVHKPQEGKLDERGIYAYSGCLEGRGFDETGERGFILLDIGEEITHTFVPFSERTIVERDVDVSGVSDAHAASLAVRAAVAFDKENLYRINLVGEVPADVGQMGEDAEKYLADACFYISVKDRTRRKIDAAAFEKDVSLRGEFVRAVYADEELSEEEKEQILRCGLRALAGEEIEL